MASRRLTVSNGTEAPSIEDQLAIKTAARRRDPDFLGLRAALNAQHDLTAQVQTRVLLSALLHALREAGTGAAPTAVQLSVVEATIKPLAKLAATCPTDLAAVKSVFRSPEFMRRGAGVVVSVAREFPDHGAIVEPCLATLRAVVRGDPFFANRIMLNKKAGPLLFVGLLGRHPDIPGILESVCEVLANLAALGGVEAGLVDDLALDVVRSVVLLHPDQTVTVGHALRYVAGAAVVSPAVREALVDHGVCKWILVALGNPTGAFHSRSVLRAVATLGVFVHGVCPLQALFTDAVEVDGIICGLRDAVLRELPDAASVSHTPPPPELLAIADGALRVLGDMASSGAELEATLLECGLLDTVMAVIACPCVALCKPPDASAAKLFNLAAGVLAMTAANAAVPDLFQPQYAPALLAACAHNADNPRTLTLLLSAIANLCTHNSLRPGLSGLYDTLLPALGRHLPLHPGLLAAAAQTVQNLGTDDEDVAWEASTLCLRGLDAHPHVADAVAACFGALANLAAHTRVCQGLISRSFPVLESTASFLAFIGRALRLHADSTVAVAAVASAAAAVARSPILRREALRSATLYADDTVDTDDACDAYLETFGRRQPVLDTQPATFSVNTVRKAVQRMGAPLRAAGLRSAGDVEEDLDDTGRAVDAHNADPTSLLAVLDLADTSRGPEATGLSAGPRGTGASALISPVAVPPRRRDPYALRPQDAAPVVPLARAFLRWSTARDGGNHVGTLLCLARAVGNLAAEPGLAAAFAVQPGFTGGVGNVLGASGGAPRLEQCLFDACANLGASNPAVANELGGGGVVHAAFAAAVRATTLAWSPPAGLEAASVRVFAGTVVGDGEEEEEEEEEEYDPAAITVAPSAETTLRAVFRCMMNLVAASPENALRLQRVQQRLVLRFSGSRMRKKVEALLLEARMAAGSVRVWRHHHSSVVAVAPPGQGPWDLSSSLWM